MSYFAMGGYAAYVWPAFGVAAVILIALLLLSLRTLRAREAVLRNLEDSRGIRRRSRDGKGRSARAVDDAAARAGEEKA
jgi:heme exporter protein D